MVSIEGVRSRGFGGFVFDLVWYVFKLTLDSVVIL